MPLCACCRITGWHAFDPNGGDDENSGLLPALYDGSKTTAWQTECYANQYMGSIQYVGVALDLAGSTKDHALEITLGAAPWNLEFYTSNDAEVPATLAGWGAPAGQQNSSSKNDLTATFKLPTDGAAHALVLFRQLPVGPKCSGSNPYQGSIGEITLTPVAG